MDSVSSRFHRTSPRTSSLPTRSHINETALLDCMGAPEEEEKQCAPRLDLHRAVGKLADGVLEAPHEPPKADPPKMTEADWREVYLSIGKLAQKKS
jgi:hypothetical protein